MQLPQSQNPDCFAHEVEGAVEPVERIVSEAPGRWGGVRVTASRSLTAARMLVNWRERVDSLPDSFTMRHVLGEGTQLSLVS